ncbi:MAG: hypothetical protein U0793_12815 [Gemmataceae bacterium]
MPATKKIFAFDLGAESGRGLIGHFDGERIQLEVLHRFPNGAVATLDTLHWDVLFLYQEMPACCASAADHGDLASIGASTPGASIMRCWKRGRNDARQPAALSRSCTPRGRWSGVRRSSQAGHLPPHRHPVHASTRCFSSSP